MSGVGVLHPGSMGAALGRALVAGGQEVLWCGDGRSQATRARAAAAGLTEVESVAELCARSRVILSVCPPQAAEAVAAMVASSHFAGVFADLNSISPARVARIASKVESGGGRAVDGGVVGAPPGSAAPTTVLLAGPGAAIVADLFEGTPIDVAIVSERVGAASALKLAFSVATKGIQAAYTVGAALAAGWELEPTYQRLFTDQHANDPALSMARTGQVAARAWRFEPEMGEAAEACRQLGLPDGAARAAEEVYLRWAGHRDNDAVPVADLLAELLQVRPRG